MNLLKKISIIFPIAAMLLFIYTLSTLHSEEENTIVTSTLVTDIHTSALSSYITETTTDVTTTVTEVSSVTTTTSVPVTTIPVQMTTVPEETYTGIQLHAIVPETKLPQAVPPAEIAPQPVETPYEIVFVSIELIDHDVTTTEETTTEIITEIPESETFGDTEIVTSPTENTSIDEEVTSVLDDVYNY